MKRRIILFALSSLLFVSFNSPKKYKIYNDWSNVTLVDTLYTSQVSDTVFAICSNRKYDPEQTEFLGHVPNSDQSIHYFVATFKNGNWLIDKVANLDVTFKYLPHKDLVIYTEGMGKTLPLNLKRSAAMTTQYDLNVLMFDYPSIHPDKSIFSNFYFAYNQAKEAYRSFNELLAQFIAYHQDNIMYFQGINTTLFFHSMGNQVLKQSVVHNDDVFRHKHLFNNVVLNAACVPRWHHVEWIEGIQFADRIYVHFNKQDKQLNGASIITLDKMLGVNPGKDHAENAIYIDFNELVGKRHSNFLDIAGRENIEEEAQQYYFSVLHGHAPQVEDRHWFASGQSKVYVLKDN